MTDEPQMLPQGDPIASTDLTPTNDRGEVIITSADVARAIATAEPALRHFLEARAA